MKKTVLALALLIPTPLLAHGGGLDKNGCHTNRKTGDYHCHGGAPAPAPSYRPPAAPAPGAPLPAAPPPVSSFARTREPMRLGSLPGTDSCRAIETLLKALGYFTGVPDASPDRASLDAAIKFRRDHQLTSSITPMDGPLLVSLSEAVLARSK